MADTMTEEPEPSAPAETEGAGPEVEESQSLTATFQANFNFSAAEDRKLLAITVVGTVAAAVITALLGALVIGF